MAYQQERRNNISVKSGETAILLESRVGKGDTPVTVDMKGTSGAGTLYLESSSDGFSSIVALKNSGAIADISAAINRLTLLKESDAASYPLRNAFRVKFIASADSEIDYCIACLEK